MRPSNLFSTTCCASALLLIVFLAGCLPLQRSASSTASPSQPPASTQITPGAPSIQPETPQPTAPPEGQASPAESRLDLGQAGLSQPINLGWATDAVWSPDGKLLAVASSAGVQLYNAATFAMVRSFPYEDISADWQQNLEMVPEHIVFAPDGSAVVVSGFYGYQFIDLEQGVAFKRTAQYVGEISFTPDGRQMAYFRSDCVRTCTTEVDLVSTQDGSLVRSFPSGDSSLKPETLLSNLVHPLHQQAMSPDGKELATYEGTSAIRVWEVGTGKLLFDLTPSTGDSGVSPLTVSPLTANLVGLAFSPDGKELVSLDTTPELVFWDVSGTGGKIRTISHMPNLPDLLIVNRNMALVGFQDGSYQTWNIATGDQIRILEKGTEEIRSFRPDGQQFVATQTDRVVVWDTLPQIRVAELEGYSAYQDRMLFSPSGKYLALLTWLPDAGLSAPPDSQVMDIRILDPIAQPPALKMSITAPYCEDPPLAISPEGGSYPPNPLLAVFIQPMSTVMVWDIGTGEKLQEIPIADVQGLAFNPISMALVLASTGGISEWDIATKQMNERIQFDPGAGSPQISSLAFNKDGTALIDLEQSEGALHVKTWSLAEKRLLSDFSPRLLESFDLSAYDIHSPLLARLTVEYFTSEPKRRSVLEIWDIQARVLKQSYPGVDWDPSHLVFNPSGSLALAQGFKDIALWRAANGQMAAAATGFDFANVAYSGDWLAVSKYDHTVYVVKMPGLK